MATIDPASLSPVERYRLLIGMIVPRPIAWVITSDGETVNLAPFSFFNGVTSSPPTVMLSIGHRKTPKDTLTNLLEQGEAVIHMVDGPNLEACHASGGEYAAHISEVEQLGLSTQPSKLVKPPRLTDCSLAMECRYSQHLKIGEPAATAVFLEVLLVHADERILGEDGLPNPQAFQPVARLGDRAYLNAGLWATTDLQRQAVPAEFARPK